MSAVVNADRQSVWRALTVPSELIQWDERILELLEPVEGYPRPGQHVRWRYRLGTVPIVMHDRPLEVSVHEKLRSMLSLGLLQLEFTHTLADSKVTVDPKDLKYYGKAGEEYYGWAPDAKSPKFKVHEPETGREVGGFIFTAC